MNARISKLRRCLFDYILQIIRVLFFLFSFNPGTSLFIFCEAYVYSYI